MTRFIFPIILVVIAVGLFLKYTNSTYSTMSKLRTENAAYDEALFNSSKLLEVRDELAKKYSNFSTEDKERLVKMMPDNVDNIRLIIDIQNIASKYNMVPREVRFDTPSVGGASSAQVSPDQLRDAGKSYGTFGLDFSVSGNYANFISFLKDLEKSLRIVDISSITFSTSDATGTSYKYNFKIKTYWLKN